MTPQSSPVDVLTDLDVLRAAATDRSGWPVTNPAGVLRPRDVADVQRLLAWAHGTGTPVIARGAGSGLAGGRGRRDRSPRPRPLRPRSHPRPRRGRAARPRRAGRHHRRAGCRGIRSRSHVRPRSRQRRNLDHRRQHRHQRRRPALREVRRDPRPRARARCGARRWHARPRRPGHHQGRDRIRPRRPLHRLGGHPRRHRRSHGAADPSPGPHRHRGGLLPDITAAARAVAAITRSGARPAVLEILDGPTLAAIDALEGTALRDRGDALLVIQTDGFGAEEELARHRLRHRAARHTRGDGDGCRGIRSPALRTPPRPARARGPGSRPDRGHRGTTSGWPRPCERIEAIAEKRACASSSSATPATATCTPSS